MALDMKKEKKKKPGKAMIITCSIIAGILLIYGCLQLFGVSVFYPEFSSSSENACRIPGLDDGFIPQGVTSFEGESEIFVCGYMQKAGNSRIYRIAEDGSVVKILLQREDGTDYKGHAGGITAAGNYVYVSNASKIFVIEKETLLAAKDGDTVRFAGYFPVTCRSSFCSSDGSYLYVGEYHADGYETEDSHIINTSDGGTYAAFVYAYALSDEGEFGIADKAKADKIYSVCDAVQGFAILPDGRAALSCSSGASDSKLRLYDVKGDPDGTAEGLPLYVLDAKRHISDLRMPHMSEDIECRGGKLLVGFEAGAKKYGSGWIPFSLKSVYRLSY